MGGLAPGPPSPPSARHAPGNPGRSSKCCPPRLAGAAQLLGLLEDLPFCLDRRSDDQLRLLELADALRAHRPHAGPDGSDEVQRAVLGERGPEENLLEWARDADADA